MDPSHEMIELIERQNAGESVDFHLFWGKESFLSQWYPSPFMDNDKVQYVTAEHFMMAQKARMFGDTNKFEAILNVNSPSEAKRLGRQVDNFDPDVWGIARQDIVFRGSVLKFCSDNQLRTQLLATKSKVLVEAAPYDKVWGIGLRAQSIESRIVEKWRGLNLLGFALMRARKFITDDGDPITLSVIERSVQSS